MKKSLSYGERADLRRKLDLLDRGELKMSMWVWTLYTCLMAGFLVNWHLGRITSTIAFYGVLNMVTFGALAMLWYWVITEKRSANDVDRFLPWGVVAVNIVLVVSSIIVFLAHLSGAEEIASATAKIAALFVTVYAVLFIWSLERISIWKVLFHIYGGLCIYFPLMPFIRLYQLMDVRRMHRRLSH